MTVSAFLKPCDSPSNAMYACRMPCAASSSAMAWDCSGGTTGSSRPCSSRIGQVASVTCPSGARSVYTPSKPGSGPTSPSRYLDSKSCVARARPRRSETP